jgi:hypothetical protein
MDPKTNKTIRRAIRLDRALGAPDDPWTGFDLDLMTEALKHSLLVAGVRRPRPRWRPLTPRKDRRGTKIGRPAEFPGGKKEA